MLKGTLGLYNGKMVSGCRVNPAAKRVHGVSGGQFVTDTRIQNDWDVNPVSYSSPARLNFNELLVLSHLG